MLKVLKFVGETRTKSPYLPSKVTLPQLFNSFWIDLRASSKRQTDVLEITTFLPASDSLFCSRLMFKQSYLTWSDLHPQFQRDGNREIRKPRNSLCKQLTMMGQCSTILPCFFAFMWTVEQSEDCSPLFLIQQQEGKKMLW